MPVSYVVQQGKRKKKKKKVKHAVLNGEQVGRCRDVGWEEEKEKASDN